MAVVGIQRKGLCLPNPFPQESGAQFRRFVQACKDHRCYNPWPELVPTRDPLAIRYAWSQPVIRGWYVPTTQAEQLLTDFVKNSLPLRLWVASVHESMHIALDFTPAKEWVRMCVALTYYALLRLLDAPLNTTSDEVEHNWTVFRTFNGLAVESLMGVSLADELLATALSFGGVTLQARTSEQRNFELRALRQIEYSWTRAMGTRFEKLYWGDDGRGGFRKAATLLLKLENELRTASLARLGIVLEPIIKGQRLVTVGDSVERCYHLAKWVVGAESGSDLLDWLDDQALESPGAQKVRADIRQWRVVLGVEAGFREDEEFENLNQVTDALWRIARGKRNNEEDVELSDLALQVQKRYWEWSRTDEWRHTLFYPEPLGDHWYVTPLVQEDIDDYMGILMLEALRQQLASGVGFICPGIGAGKDKRTCTCADRYPSLKKKILRLSKWALAGAFGSGEWTDLPHPCGKRC